MTKRETHSVLGVGGKAGARGCNFSMGQRRRGRPKGGGGRAGTWTSRCPGKRSPPGDTGQQETLSVPRGTSSALSQHGQEGRAEQ